LLMPYINFYLCRNGWMNDNAIFRDNKLGQLTNGSLNLPVS